MSLDEEQGRKVTAKIWYSYKACEPVCQLKPFVSSTLVLVAWMT